MIDFAARRLEFQVIGGSAETLLFAPVESVRAHVNEGRDRVRLLAQRGQRELRRAMIPTSE
jgi:hypothetical protein